MAGNGASANKTRRTRELGGAPRHGTAARSRPERCASGSSLCNRSGQEQEGKAAFKETRQGARSLTLSHCSHRSASRLSAASPAEPCTAMPLSQPLSHPQSPPRRFPLPRRVRDRAAPPQPRPLPAEFRAGPQRFPNPGGRLRGWRLLPSRGRARPVPAALGTWSGTRRVHRFPCKTPSWAVLSDGRSSVPTERG